MPRPQIIHAGLVLLIAFLGSIEVLKAADRPSGSIETGSDGQAIEPFPAEAAIVSEQSKETWKFSWENGLLYTLDTELVFRPLELLREEPLVRGKVFLKLHLDAAMYSGDGGASDIDDVFDLRRGRLGIKGDRILRMPISYLLNFGFTSDKFFLEENYLRLDEIPYLGSLQIGHFKPPISLNRMTSSSDTTFMELASPIQAIAPASSAGIQLSNLAFNDRFHWSAGWFGPSGGDAEIGDGRDSLSRILGRAGWLVVDRPDDSLTQSLLHIGVSFGLAASFEEATEFSARPESFFAPKVLRTGRLAVDSAIGGGVDLAFIRGPYAFQAEAITTRLELPGADDSQIGGYYVQGSRFLTHDSRPFNRRKGAFGRVNPTDAFSFAQGGMGAWELGARFSHLDLNERPINAGQMNNYSAALNWYINNTTKVRFNYVFSDIDRSGDDMNLHSFQVRLQIEF